MHRETNEMEDDNQMVVGEQRNKYTRNRYEFDRECVVGYVYNRQNIEVGFFMVDADDFEKINKFKWCKNKNGYLVTWKDSKIQYLHHLITGHASNKFSVVDHINRDKADNRKRNLRVVSRSLNSMNSNQVQGVSSYRGVYYDKSRERFVARLMRHGKLVIFRRFKTEKEAAQAYLSAREEVYGI